MTGQLRLTAVAAVLGASLALAACSNIGSLAPGGAQGNPLTASNNTEALRRAAPPGATTFPGALAGEYLMLADDELKEYDWGNADHYARKGLASTGGNIVQPDPVNSRSIPREKVGELESAYQRLNAALNGGGRERLPVIAARAQSRYDCWLEEQEENWQVDDISDCRAQFLAAMSELERQPVPPAPAPAAGPREYRVYFEFDKSNLTPEGRQIVERMVQEVRGGSVRLELVGKADRAGPEDYNQRLSERRARTVVDELVRLGVPRDRISSRAVGETQPPVPTPDGVREPRNRVVEITVR
jgi:OmpA-OmpF porin, OOP family